MVTFYRFPKIIGSMCAHQSGGISILGYKKVANAEALIWKILMIAEKNFRRLNSPELLAAVYHGNYFQDGMPIQETNLKRHAA